MIMEQLLHMNKMEISKHKDQIHLHMIRQLKINYEYRISVR